MGEIVVYIHLSNDYVIADYRLLVMSKVPAEYS